MHKVMIETIVVDCNGGRAKAIMMLNDALGGYLDSITEQGGTIVSVQIDPPFGTSKHDGRFTWARTHTIVANVPASYQDPYR